MLNDITIQKNKRLRGEILHLLHATRPGTIEMRTLSNLLLDSGMIDNPDISPYIDYLADKGYITTITPEDTKRVFKGALPPSSFAKLTAHGVDLMERTISDPGVDV